MPLVFRPGLFNLTRMVGRRIFVIAVLGVAVTASFPAAAFTSYQSCVDLTVRDPDAAYDQAEEWRRDGGGVPALHCAALALSRLGLHKDAAERLELAARSSAGTLEQTTLYEQAGHAWLLASDAGAARRVFDAALTLMPDDANLLVARAQSAVMMQAWEMALTDLDHALTLDNRLVDALVLRAAARRNMGDIAAATGDIDAALAIAPDHDAALLERGLLRFTQGDAPAAEADWMQIIDTPTSSDAARAAAEDYLLQATQDVSAEPMQSAPGAAAAVTPTSPKLKLTIPAIPPRPLHRP